MSEELIIVDTYKRTYLRLFWLCILNAAVISFAWPQIWPLVRFVWLMSFAILCGWTERWGLRVKGWKEPVTGQYPVLTPDVNANNTYNRMGVPCGIVRSGDDYVYPLHAQMKIEAQTQQPFVCAECRKLNKNWYDNCPHVTNG